jgi:hypothetical protein
MNVGKWVRLCAASRDDLPDFVACSNAVSELSRSKGGSLWHVKATAARRLSSGLGMGYIGDDHLAGSVAGDDWKEG